MKFKEEDFVEQTNLGDVPFMVVRVYGTPEVPRYDLEGIDGSRYDNIPGYMVVQARPASQSVFGARA